MYTLYLEWITSKDLYSLKELLNVMVSLKGEELRENGYM